MIRSPHGDTYKAKILVQVAQNAKSKRKSFYRAKYNKLVFKLGSKNKAKEAIANRIARSVYKILCGGNYKEIWYNRGDSHEAQVRKHVSALKALGVNVFHHNHQRIVSKKRVVVEQSGIILSG
ncbi:MAG: hypothetical protein K1X29_08605 [Bdellovibrionales bacterium]|nr:hypothetical protein [Bdellovibrionales bacterium]